MRTEGRSHEPARATRRRPSRPAAGRAHARRERRRRARRGGGWWWRGRSWQSAFRGLRERRGAVRSAWYAVACSRWISEGFMTVGILLLEPAGSQAAGRRLAGVRLATRGADRAVIVGGWPHRWWAAGIWRTGRGGRAVYGGRCRRCSAFETGDLPGDAVVGERGLQAVSLELGEHRGGRVREGAQVAGHQPEGEVLGGDGRARGQVAGRVAEDGLARGVVGRGAEQLFVVGLAADDAVEDDD